MQCSVQTMHTAHVLVHCTLNIMDDERCTELEYNKQAPLPPEQPEAYNFTNI